MHVQTSQLQGRVPFRTAQRDRRLKRLFRLSERARAAVDDADTHLDSGIAGLSASQLDKRGECRVQPPLRAVDQAEIVIDLSTRQ